MGFLALAPFWKQRLARWATGVGMIILLDLLGIGLCFPCAQQKQIRLPAELPDPPPPVLVLGASVRPSANPSPVLEARLKTALYLFQSGKASWILVSGDNRSIYYNEPQAMQKWLIKQGVPATRVIKDYAGRRTFDSLQRAKRVFGIRRLTIVTSSLHAPRALFLAKSMDLEAFAVPASTQNVPLRSKCAFWLREWAARHIAIWDRYFPPTPLLGPREATPEDLFGQKKFAAAGTRSALERIRLKWAKTNADAHFRPSTMTLNPSGCQFTFFSIEQNKY